MADNSRRKSSILKTPKQRPRTPLLDVNTLHCDEEDPTGSTPKSITLRRRVSFAGTNLVKEFYSESECVSVWQAPAYEEPLTVSSDSSGIPSDCSSGTSLLLHHSLHTTQTPINHVSSQSTVAFKGEDPCDAIMREFGSCRVPSVISSQPVRKTRFSFGEPEQINIQTVISKEGIQNCSSSVEDRQCDTFHKKAVLSGNSINHRQYKSQGASKVLSQPLGQSAHQAPAPAQCGNTSSIKSTTACLVRHEKETVNVTSTTCISVNHTVSKSPYSFGHPKQGSNDIDGLDCSTTENDDEVFEHPPKNSQPSNMDVMIRISNSVGSSQHTASVLSRNFSDALGSASSLQSFVRHEIEMGSFPLNEAESKSATDDCTNKIIGECVEFTRRPMESKMVVPTTSSAGAVNAPEASPIRSKNLHMTYTAQPASATAAYYRGKNSLNETHYDHVDMEFTRPISSTIVAPVMSSDEVQSTVQVDTGSVRPLSDVSSKGPAHHNVDHAPASDGVRNSLNETQYDDVDMEFTRPISSTIIAPSMPSDQEQSTVQVDIRTVFPQSEVSLKDPGVHNVGHAFASDGVRNFLNETQYDDVDMEFTRPVPSTIIAPSMPSDQEQSTVQVDIGPVPLQSEVSLKDPPSVHNVGHALASDGVRNCRNDTQYDDVDMEFTKAISSTIIAPSMPSDQEQSTVQVDIGPVPLQSEVSLKDPPGVHNVGHALASDGIRNCQNETHYDDVDMEFTRPVPSTIIAPSMPSDQAESPEQVDIGPVPLQSDVSLKDPPGVHNVGHALASDGVRNCRNETHYDDVDMEFTRPVPSTIIAPSMSSNQAESTVQVDIRPVPLQSEVSLKDSGVHTVGHALASDGVRNCRNETQYDDVDMEFTKAISSAIIAPAMISDQVEGSMQVGINPILYSDRPHEVASSKVPTVQNLNQTKDNNPNMEFKTPILNYSFQLVASNKDKQDAVQNIHPHKSFPEAATLDNSAVSGVDGFSVLSMNSTSNDSDEMEFTMPNSNSIYCPSAVNAPVNSATLFNVKESSSSPTNDTTGKSLNIDLETHVLSVMPDKLVCKEILSTSSIIMQHHQKPYSSTLITDRTCFLDQTMEFTSCATSCGSSQVSKCSFSPSHSAFEGITQNQPKESSFATSKLCEASNTENDSNLKVPCAAENNALLQNSTKATVIDKTEVPPFNTEGNSQEKKNVLLDMPKGINMDTDSNSRTSSASPGVLVLSQVHLTSSGDMPCSTTTMQQKHSIVSNSNLGVQLELKSQRSRSPSNNTTGHKRDSNGRTTTSDTSSGVLINHKVNTLAETLEKNCNPLKRFCSSQLECNSESCSTNMDEGCSEAVIVPSSKSPSPERSLYDTIPALSPETWRMNSSAFTQKRDGSQDAEKSCEDGVDHLEHTSFPFVSQEHRLTQLGSDFIANHASLIHPINVTELKSAEGAYKGPCMSQPSNPERCKMGIPDRRMSHTEEKFSGHSINSSSSSDLVTDNLNGTGQCNIKSNHQKDKTVSEPKIAVKPKSLQEIIMEYQMQKKCLWRVTHENDLWTFSFNQLHLHLKIHLESPSEPSGHITGRDGRFVSEITEKNKPLVWWARRILMLKLNAVEITNQLCHTHDFIKLLQEVCLIIGENKSFLVDLIYCEKEFHLKLGQEILTWDGVSRPCHFHFILKMKLDAWENYTPSHVSIENRIGCVRESNFKNLVDGIPKDRHFIRKFFEDCEALIKTLEDYQKEIH